MILTRHWLNAFIDVKEVSEERLSQTLNSLGLEVDTIEARRAPDDIVIGYVRSCHKHPDADKLNVCEVDVGDEVLQIVCGAKNVKEGLFVPVAKVGAKVYDRKKEGVTFEITNSTLRGVESCGMICSSEEMGFPFIGDGIVALDESILDENNRSLEKGKALNAYALFNDVYIDLEITPNRGDCLSILGIARELSCGLNQPLKTSFEQEPHKLNNVRIDPFIKIEFDTAISSSLTYHLLKRNGLDNPLRVDIMCGYIGVEEGNPLDKFLRYISHAAGVILNTYPIASLNEKDPIYLKLQKDERELTALYHQNGDKLTKLSTIGVCSSQCDGGELSAISSNRADEDINNGKRADKTLSSEGQSAEDQRDEFTSSVAINNEWLLLETSYTPPTELCKNVVTHKVKTDEKIYFNSSRGSNPDIDSGIKAINQELAQGALPFELTVGYINYLKKYPTISLICSVKKLRAIIGQDIACDEMIFILNRLQFSTKTDGSINENIILEVPRFRHDIANIQDVAEELLRVINIDTIEPKKLHIQQQKQMTPSFKNYTIKRAIRERCIANGFFENVSFVFGQRSVQQSLGFEVCQESLDLQNPITQELDTLRSTLLVGLLDAVKRNKNNNFDSIEFFEIGSIFDARRKESSALAFVSSGFKTTANVTNDAKREKIDFYHFADKICNILPNLEIRALTKVGNALINPYQSAGIYLKGIYIGYIAKLHYKVQRDLKIDDTFIAEFDLDHILTANPTKSYNAISKFPKVDRDLSLVMDKNILFQDIKATIDELNIPELKSFYPISLFELDEGQISLSVRFELQSATQTLTEEDIQSIVIDNILHHISNNMPITLRA